MKGTVQDIFSLNAGFLQTKDLERRAQWYQLKKMIDKGEAVKLSSGIYKLNPNYALEKKGMFNG